jgi:hypothetical protein
MSKATWVLSTSDGQWHALLSGESPTADSPKSVALCGLTIPVDQITAGVPVPQFMHRACLIAYGRSMPYDPRSEQD